MVEAVRAMPCSAGGDPRIRLAVGLAVADVGLFGVQLHDVAGRDGEAHALAGLQQFAGRDALGGDAVGPAVLVERSKVAFVLT